MSANVEIYFMIDDRKSLCQCLIRVVIHVIENSLSPMAVVCYYAPSNLYSLDQLL